MANVLPHGGAAANRSTQATSSFDADAQSPNNHHRVAMSGEAAPTKHPVDSGATAWLHVVLMHIVFFNTWGVANGYGVFQEFYTRTLGQDESAVAWIGSVQVFFLFSIGVIAGRITDAGYFRVVFTCGVSLQVFALFMLSLCSTYWQIFLAQAVCLGIGNGLTFCPALAVLSQYFHTRRALAVGLSAAGAAVGGLVYPILIHWLLFRDDIGFSWTIRAMAFIMFATYAPCLVLFRPRLPPSDMAGWVDWSAFSDVAFIFFSLSMFLNFWGLYLAFFYLGTFARDQIGSSGDAAPINLVMVLNGVGIIGRIFPPLVADKWTGMLNLLVPSSFMASVLVFCWAAVDSEAGLFAFAVVYGILAAALQALFPAVAITMTPTPEKTGTRVGMIFSFVSLANLTGPAICGAIIRQRGGSYIGAQMFGASSILLGAIMAACVRRSRARRWKCKV